MRPLLLSDSAAFFWGRELPLTSVDLLSGSINWTLDPASGLSEEPVAIAASLTDTGGILVLLRPTQRGERYWLRLLDGHDMVWTRSWPNSYPDEGRRADLTVDENGMIYVEVRVNNHHELHALTVDGSSRWSEAVQGDTLVAEGGAIVQWSDTLSAIDGSSLLVQGEDGRCLPGFHHVGMSGIFFAACRGLARYLHIQAVEGSTGRVLWQLPIEDLGPPGAGVRLPRSLLLTDRPSLLALVGGVFPLSELRPPLRVNELALADGSIERSCLVRPDRLYEDARIHEERLYLLSREELQIFHLPGAREARRGWSSPDANNQGTRRAR